MIRPVKPHVIVCCALVWLTSFIVSSTASAEDDAHVLEHIGIEGLARVDEAAALGATKLKQGDLFDADKVTADLRILWRSGFFTDVVALQKPCGKGICLSWQVKEKPSIRQIDVVGRDAISDDDVKGALDIKPFTILNRATLRRNADKIRDLYVGRGYYLAHVDYRLVPLPDRHNEVDVIFTIEERERVTVRAITFLGNKYIDSNTLRAAMQTRVGHEMSWLTQAGTYREEDLETDLMRLQALYYDQGFVSVKMLEPKATLSADRRYIYLTLTLEEGEPFAVGTVNVTGKVELPSDDEQGLGPLHSAEVAAVLTEKSGDTFSRTKLMEDVQALTDLYRDRGYAYANITPNTQIDAESRRVELNFEVDPGEPVSFERIDIVGNVRTRDKVIRRELAIFEGERFNAQALNRSRARIYQLGFFESVELVTKQGSAPENMQVTVEVKEKSTGTFQIGAGFSSLENFIATAQISQNNFLGGGQELSLSAQLSFGTFARQLASLQFKEPYLFDSPVSFGFGAYLQQRFYRDFQRNARGFGPTFGYPLTHDLRLAAGYTLEFVEITTQSAQQDAVLYNLNRDGRVSSVNAALTYDSRDNYLMPTKGLFGEGRFEISSKYLGADPSMGFKRSELTLRAYHPVLFNVIARMNLQLGWIFGAPGGTVPISERYFPGGIYSVRGFQPRGLGPVQRVIKEVSNPAASTRDFVIGGNKQAIANFELEIPILPMAGLRGVIFVDMGNAYDDDEGLFYLDTPRRRRASGFLMGSNKRVDLPLGLFYSFGFGLRWQSPIGPLRFEWGIPITKHDSRDRDIMFEFTIGNFF